MISQTADFPSSGAFRVAGPEAFVEAGLTHYDVDQPALVAPHVSYKTPLSGTWRRRADSGGVGAGACGRFRLGELSALDKWKLCRLPPWHGSRSGRTHSRAA